MSWSALFLLAMLSVSLCVLPRCARDTPRYPEVRAGGGEVLVGLRDIPPGAGRFSSYRTSSGKLVDFFVYLDSAGSAHVVLDACRTCYRWKKGYLLDGDDLVCAKCGMRYTIDGLATGIGSCVPIALHAERRRDTLAIPVAEFEAGARFF